MPLISGCRCVLYIGRKPVRQEIMVSDSMVFRIQSVEPCIVETVKAPVLDILPS